MFKNENLKKLIFKQFRFAERDNMLAILKSTILLNIVVPLKLVVKEHQRLEEHSNKVTCLINHTRGQIISASRESIRLWEPDSLDYYKCKQVIPTDSHHKALVSLGNDCFASCSFDSITFDFKILIWNGKSCTRVLDQETGVHFLLLLPNGLLLCDDNELQLLNPEKGFELAYATRVSIGGGVVKALLLSNGKLFASVWFDDSIMICDINPEFKFIKKVNDYDRVSCMVELPDGNIVTAGKKTIKVYDNDLNCIKDIKDPHPEQISSMVLVSDGLLVSASAGTIKIWDVYSGFKCLRTINEAHAYGNKINALVKLPSGGFASCSDDKIIKIWELFKYLNI
jgi:WD40 repeat protein